MYMRFCNNCNKQYNALLLFFLVFSAYSLTCFTQDTKERLCQSTDAEVMITAYNLSEDLSPLASQSDEILIAIYQLGDSSTSPKVLTAQTFTVTQKDSMKIAFFRLNPSPPTDSLLIFLIERDSDTGLNDYISKLRNHEVEFYRSAKTGDYRKVDELLGNDDLLGTGSLVLGEITPSNNILMFEGVHLFDRYKYRIGVYFFRALFPELH